jgi:hypothetical protein
MPMSLPPADALANEGDLSQLLMALLLLLLTALDIMGIACPPCHCCCLYLHLCCISTQLPAHCCTNWESDVDKPLERSYLDLTLQNQGSALQKSMSPSCSQVSKQRSFLNSPRRRSKGKTKKRKNRGGEKGVGGTITHGNPFMQMKDGFGASHRSSGSPDEEVPSHHLGGSGYKAFYSSPRLGVTRVWCKLLSGAILLGAGVILWSQRSWFWHEGNVAYLASSPGKESNSCKSSPTPNIWKNEHHTRSLQSRLITNSALTVVNSVISQCSNNS